MLTDLDMPVFLIELNNGPLFRLCTCFHGFLLLVFVDPSDSNGGDALKLRV